MVRSKLKSIGVGAVSAALIAAAPAAVLASSDNGNSNAQNKVTICHATGSTTNPFVQITPDANGVVSGHLNHQDMRDIIPPFTYNDHGTTKSFAGQNWDDSGQVIFNSGCVVTSSQSGGQGGGGGTTTTGGNQENGQVLGSVTGGQGGVSQTPQGGVNAGAGGGNALSVSNL